MVISDQLAKELLAVLESGEKGVTKMATLSGRITWYNKMFPIRERLRMEIQKHYASKAQKTR